MLQLKYIHKQYRTGGLVQNALKDVSLNLRDNEFVSILGPSGSGKTTLLNVIGGLDRYDAGDLVINGVSTKNYNDRDWDTYRNQTIGFVFQSYNLIPHQTVLSNVELAMTIAGVPREKRKQRAERALARVGLGDQLHKKPSQMSGGQMQRVAIARALVNDPDILLADEPTGALDTDTSVQIMEILKEVARDRLVVMVTHNPELAEQYSTRIIKLRDGEIIGDTMPYDPEKEADAPAENGSMEKGAPADNGSRDLKKRAGTRNFTAGTSAASGRSRERSSRGRRRSNMSLFTSLALSFNNLRTKKGRTLLTSFAGSIGIIGIALVLALTAGVRSYITDVQTDTLTAYPLTIESKAVDMSGLGTDSASQNGQKESGAKDGIYADNSGSLTSGVITNNLKKFKAYLDDPESDIRGYLGKNGIVYSYDVSFDAYTKDPSGAYVNSGADPESSGQLTSGASSGSFPMFSGGSQTEAAQNFSELMAGPDGKSVSKVLKDNYEVLYGKWPEEKDQLVLVLDENNALPTRTLYQLGLITKEQYKGMNREIADSGSAKKLDIDYEGMCGRSFYLVPACDRYTQDSDGKFRRLDDSSADINELVSKGLEVKISGVVKPKKGESTASVSTALGYTRALTDHLIKYTDESAVVKAQKADPARNVLNGVEFNASTDEEKVSEAKKYISSLGVSDKAAMYQRVMMYMAQNAQGQQDGTEGEAAAAQQQSYTGAGKAGNSMSGPALAVKTEAALTPDQQAALDAAQSQQGAAAQDQTAQTADPNQAAQQQEQTADPDQTAQQQEQTADPDQTAQQPAQEAQDQAAQQAQPTDESSMAAAMDAWLQNSPDRGALLTIYSEFISGYTYEDNLKSFGSVDYDDPSSISIYTDSFSDKEAVARCINKYNRQAKKADRITYTDYVKLLTSSLNRITDMISYVMIALMAVSLVVSCIMIGIITHISVMERTKEIGILRALGASKRNVSEVFNAETFIIGCFSGIIGVLVSSLLTIPMNSIMHSVMENGQIHAYLPVKYAALLILLSMVITVIGGLLPARSAAKKDPVESLRTE
ncbi:MAG: ABC transporter ATP-binding protein/permease [Anaerovoracaceae bacterium]|nr:ABC transporter ATP-binding protein/permease [Bacillota bacterium]MDY2670986.1 ABC transporter ATP-binding protein/permease [Anaerovoracaceae bacterium]